MTRIELQALNDLAKDHPIVGKLLKEYNTTNDTTVVRFNTALKNLVDELSNEIEHIKGASLITSEDRTFERVMMILDKAVKVKEALGEQKPSKKPEKNDEMLKL